PGLRETNVINPRWITEAVYEIINSKSLANSKGSLTIESLKTLLDSDKYPPKKHGFIIELMKKFELCYNVDKNTVLLPDLLEVAEPDFDFDESNCLKFYLSYDFLPKSVMARFIVKRSQEIKNNLRWRSGVVLENKSYNSTAVIKADAREKKIRIDVAGDLKRDWFAVLRDTFKEIHGSFEKLDVDEMVPLPGNSLVAVPYSELTGYELAGRDEYFSGKLGKAFSIKLLLNGIVSEVD
ncbi:MAG: hypothetical protein GY757_48915, partial [bacterium]|nr:hypothetical protein [bacterium]